MNSDQPTIAWVRSLGVRGRLTLLVLSTVVPAFVLVIYTNLRDDMRERAHTERDMQTLVRAVAREEHRLFLAAQAKLLFAANANAVRHGSPAACSRFMRTLLAGSDSIANIGVADARGRLHCSALPLNQRIDVSQRAFFRGAIARKGFAVGAAQIGALTGKVQNNIGYPLFENGRLKAVVFAAMDLSWIGRMAADLDLPAQTSLLLFGPNGELLARYPDPGKWLHSPPPEAAVLPALRRNLDRRLETSIDGRHYTFSPLARFGTSDMAIAMGLPTRAMYSGVNRALVTGITLLLAAIAIALGLAWWGATRLVVVPLRALVHGTRRLAQGERNARVALDTGGEMGLLARAFNQMAESLELRAQELRYLNESLERRVRERTDELEQVNEALRKEAAERDRVQRALMESEQRLRTIIDSEPACVKLMSSDGKLVQVNAAGLAMIEADSEHEIIGLSVLDLVKPEYRGAYRAFMKSIMGGERGSIEFGIVGLRGTHRWLESHAVPVREAGGQSYSVLTITHDITERKHAQDHVHYLAHYDVLTGLPNRLLLHDRLSQAIIEAERRQRVVAVVMVDVDRFKKINDSLGHETGDRVLKAVAQRLRETVREGDTVARLGGDEFAVALSDMASSDHAGLVGRKIMDAFSAPFHLDARELFLSVSLGVAVHPHHGATAEDLLRNADVAMYQAKEQGRAGCQIFSAELTAKASHYLAMDNALRKAIEREEFLLHYQPMVDLRTGRVAGVEALIRWGHPSWGLVSPAQFIPLAEETGLILPIGEWVMSEACKQMRAWHVLGLSPVRVSVNLSSRQLQYPQLGKSIIESIERERFSADCLELELTESMLMQTAQGVEMLRELRAKGVRISVDDFGTGYSSLSYLRRLPIDVLKIDRSFVQDARSDAGAVAIVGSIIALAHNLGLEVVAEGVETREQLALLQAHGCDFAQGFYLAPPLPADEVATVLRTPVAIPSRHVRGHMS